MEFAARKSGPAELREVAGEPEVFGVEVAEGTAGEFAAEPVVELVVVQSAAFAEESAEDPEVAPLC